MLPVQVFNYYFFKFYFGDGNWQQAKAFHLVLVEVTQVNALAQGALQRFTYCFWTEHTKSQLRGRQFTTELSQNLYKFKDSMQIVCDEVPYTVGCLCVVSYT